MQIDDFIYNAPVFISFFACLLSMVSLLITVFMRDHYHESVGDIFEKHSVILNRMVQAQDLQGIINAIVEYVIAVYRIKRDNIRVFVSRLSQDNSDGHNYTIAFPVANSLERLGLTTPIIVENSFALRSVVLDEKPYVFIGDMETYDKLSETYSNDRRWASIVCVPIRKDNEVIGIIQVTIKDGKMENKAKNDSLIICLHMAAEICSSLMDTR